MLDQAESQLENTGPWKNPEAPEDYGTEKDRANCPFFLKTGACRFGDRCSRMHVRPPSSTTLMIRGMFVTFSMEQSQRDDYDTDASLEFSEDDLHQNFLEFYEDVLPEFKSVGKVVQFKVSCNFEPHLRGNVYVQYDTEIECKEAFITFNGRWYAGRQLQCEFSPVTRWKTAICGLFDRKKCPKGKHCNFLHVYRNPGREFWDADRDLSPDRGGAVTGPYSERRDWSYRNHKYSPERPSGRRWGRRDRSRDRRSRSRGRRSRSRGRRSRSRGRRSRSRGRRSHTKERRNHSGQRERRSRSRGRRSHSKERQGCSRGRRSHSRERSLSRDREYRGQLQSGRSSVQRKKSENESHSPFCCRDAHQKNGSPRQLSPKGEKAENNSGRSPANSPENLDKTEKHSDSSPTHHHRKHSRKSKKRKSKKKKKKSKKNRSVSPSGSSEESEGEGGVKMSLVPQGENKTETPGRGISPLEPDLCQHLPQEAQEGLTEK